MAAADCPWTRHLTLVPRRIGRGRRAGYEITSGIHALSVHRVIRQRMLRGRVSPTKLLDDGGMIVELGLDGRSNTNESSADRRYRGEFTSAHSANSGITSRAKVLSAANEPPTSMTSTYSTPTACSRLRRPTIS